MFYIPRIKILFDNMEKGLSPLMASIILIALTLTVAAFLGSWLTSMTKSQTGTVERGGEKLINCTNARMDIATVICSNPSGLIKIAVTNIGQLELYNFSIFVKAGSNLFSNSSYPAGTINPGEQIIFQQPCDKTAVTGTCANGTTVELVRITPGNCPSAYTEETFAVVCG
jgi:flagellin-like protein